MVCILSQGGQNLLPFISGYLNTTNIRDQIRDLPPDLIILCEKHFHKLLLDLSLEFRLKTYPDLFVISLEND